MDSSPNHPLLYYLNILNVLKYLSFNEVKICRSVNSLWNYIAELWIRKQGMIVFSDRCPPSKYLTHYKQTQPIETLLLNKLKFGHCSCSVVEIYEILTKFSENMQSLNLEWMKVSIENKKLLKNLNMDQFIHLTENLTELDISAYGNQTTHFEVSLKFLSNIKSISLCNCAVNINSIDKRISPSKLALRGVNFYENGNLLDNVTVTDFIDFKNCSFICMDTCWSAESNIMFDLSKDFVSADRVELGNRIRMIKEHESKLKTIDCVLQNSSYEAISIRSKTLKLIYCVVDLTNLCITLEKINFHHCRIFPLSNQPVNLPSLKQMSIVFYARSAAEIETVSNTMSLCIPRFSNCEKLQILKLGGCKNGLWHKLDSIDIKWLPKNLNKLHMTISERFDWIGETDTIQLEELILNDSDLKVSTVEKIIQRMKPKILILQTLLLKNASDNNEVTNFISNILSKENQIEKILLETMETESNTTSGYIQNMFLDGIFQYFEFVDMKCAQITSGEFDSIAEID